MRARSISWGAVLLVACASSAYEAPRPPDPVPPPYQQPLTVVGELPPHHFYPREHAPRVAPTPVAASLASLPAMVRSGQCVAAGAVPEGRPGGTTVAKKGKKKAPGFVPYAGKPADATTTAATTTPTAPAKNDDASRAEAKSGDGGMAQAAPATEAEEAPSGAWASGADRDDEAGMAPQMSDAPTEDVTIATNNRSKRRAQRSRRKAEKAHDRALAAHEASPPAATPSADLAVAMPESTEPVVIEPQWPPPEEGWGGATYLSNDDTMSLGSAQRVLFAIDQHLPLPPEHIRPHELLNYFSFRTDPVEPGQDFSVHAEIAPSELSPGMFELGVAIAGRPVGRDGRRNAVLTLVVDRSGSMKAEGRMEFLKRGLLRMVRELKDGDIVHVVTFDHRVCTPLQNFVVGRDDTSVLTKTIHDIKPSGSTNLHAGLTQGYRLADASYQARYSNRVLVISDAIANQGVTDPATLSMVSDFYDARRIRLSGIGVGREFNDALLDRLTEQGRGAYVFLGSEAEVDAVFGSRFTSLVETLANDVHFRLHLPPSLRMEQFHGEQSSTVKRDVQAVHFFADTSQLMLADVEAWQGQLRPQDDLMLEIEYQDPETGELLVEDHVVSIAEATETHDNVRKGELIMHFITGIERLARRGAPVGWSPTPGGWRDASSLDDCNQTRGELRQLAAGSRDPEVSRILQLWDGYCRRFEGDAAGRPGRKSGDERWPGARG